MPLPSLARAAVAVLVALALALAFPLGLQAYRDHRADRELGLALLQEQEREE